MATILVIDDSATDRHVLGGMLIDAGFDVISANDGEQGIQTAQKEQPAAILMDVVMPGLNGFQATRKLKKDPSTEQIPIIMVTTKNQDTDMEWGMRQGASDYLVKPVKAKALVSKIQSLLRG